MAERVLGHAIVGVAGVYDHHAYDDEKARALAALADLIRGIVDPPSGDNVVTLPSPPGTHFVAAAAGPSAIIGAVHPRTEASQ